MTGPIYLRQRYENPSDVENYLNRRFGHAPWSVADERERNIISELVRATSARRMLDIATGPGRISDAVQAETAIAVDSSIEMLKAASNRIGDRWMLVRADAFSLPLPDLSFDLVFCFRFFRHLGPGERKTLLEEIRRVLQPEGRLAFDALNAKMGSFASRYAGIKGSGIPTEMTTPEILRRELLDAGFELEAMTPVMRHLRTYHLVNIAMRNRLLKKARRRFVRIAEKLPSRFPFGWVVVARKK